MFEAFGNMDRAMDFIEKVGLPLVYFQGRERAQEGRVGKKCFSIWVGLIFLSHPPSLPSAVDGTGFFRCN
jgi:hypothetical protein